MNERLDLAYYYPEPFWGQEDSGWIKSLLLFFDKVAILLPDYMYGRHHWANPELAGPLEDKGFLVILEPKSWIDDEVTVKLAEIVHGLLADGVFDNLPASDHFHELSQSRIGYRVNINLAESLVSELESKGVAKPSQDGVSIPLHPTVRTTILVILAQLSRLAGRKQGFIVHPSTNHPAFVRDFIASLSLDGMPSGANLIGLDLESVSFDLDPVPLDEVLHFRSEHQAAHRTYMRNLRKIMLELSHIDIPEEREVILVERRQELADAANDLQRRARNTLKRNLATWSLGLVGSAWHIAATGDVFGAALAAASVAANIALGSDDSEGTTTAYTYLFQVQKTFPV